MENKIRISVNDEFISLCEDIVRENKTDLEWSKIESDDMYETYSFNGGYDANENAFCFSYFYNNDEYWFQLTLEEIKKVLDGTIRFLHCRSAE